MGVNEYIKIGSRIKEVRKRKGLTQREMADKLNLAYSTYSNYENNHREPSFDIIEQAADILGVTLEYLMGLAETSSNLKKDYTLNKSVFIDYLYSLGYSVETPLNTDEGSSNHYIRTDDEIYKIYYKDFSNFQKECSSIITSLMKHFLDRSPRL